MTLAPLFAQPGGPIVATPDSTGGGIEALRADVERRAGDWEGLLQEHGAILFRGYALDGAADFEAAVAALGGESDGYVGGNSPRTRVLHDVFTATDYPASEGISLHNELSYRPSWPRRLFFFCDVPALRGGQTPLARGGAVLRAMPSAIVDALRAKKVNYVRRFQPNVRMGKTWQATYETDDRDRAGEIIRAQGSVARWSADGALRVSTVCDAFAVHPRTGEEVWFNQAEQWHPSALAPALRAMLEPRGRLAHHCEFGDGSPMDDAMLAAIRRVLEAHKLKFDWCKGDLLMLDNILVMHGREPFAGSRRTLAYLSRT
jgi:alpha-ketoglutarate-dependent taurine dioxygenase